MPEVVTSAEVIARHEIASVVVQLARALEQTGELLEAATDLHRQVVELHADLTGPLVDLERLARPAEPSRHAPSA
jgi:hypothetical protein